METLIVLMVVMRNIARPRQLAKVHLDGKKAISNARPESGLALIITNVSMKRGFVMGVQIASMDRMRGIVPYTAGVINSNAKIMFAYLTTSAATENGNAVMAVMKQIAPIKAWPNLPNVLAMNSNAATMERASVSRILKFVTDMMIVEMVVMKRKNAKSMNAPTASIIVQISASMTQSAIIVLAALAIVSQMTIQPALISMNVKKFLASAQATSAPT